MQDSVSPRSLAAGAPARPLSGEALVPGDKSISHRALMFGALAIGTTEITGLLEGEDVLRTAAAMRALGAEVANLGAGHWRVAGRGIGGLVEPADVLDMGNSGTAARLLCGLLAGHPIFAVMTGDASLRKRPMKRVTEPLAATGARFATRAGGRLPLAVEGAADPLPLDYEVPVPSPRRSPPACWPASAPAAFPAWSRRKRRATTPRTCCVTSARRLRWGATGTRWSSS